MAQYNTLKSLFTAICDEIRKKEGSKNKINHQSIPYRIANLPKEKEGTIIDFDLDILDKNEVKVVDK